MSQWLYMPLMAVALILLLKPHPGLALGMLLVAACPGGNVSSYLSMLARANVVLGISLVVISTVAAALATPLLFSFAAKLVASAQALPQLELDLPGMLLQVILIVFLRWRPAAYSSGVFRRWPCACGCRCASRPGW